MGVRLPTILGKAMDDTIRTLNEQWDEDKMVDLVQCIERMEQLMSDLTGKAVLRPIIDDGEGDLGVTGQYSNAEKGKGYERTQLTHSVDIKLLHS